MRLVALVVLAGCSFRPASGTPDGGGDDTDDGSPDAGEPPAGTCGKLGVFADDFADGLPRDIWLVENAAGVVEAGGTLALTPNGTPTGYTSRTRADLRGAAIAIEVPAMLDAGSDAVATFALQSGTSVVGFTQQMGTLTAAIDGSGQPTRVDVPYDAVAHRWWRIGEAAGVVTLATSPDGMAWTDVAADDGVVFADRVALALTARSTGPAGTLELQNLRISEGDQRVTLAPWCKTTTLVDEFTGAAFASQWTGFGSTSNCSVDVQSNKAHFRQSGNGPCYTALLSTSLHDLTGSQLVASVDPIVTPPEGWIATIGIGDPDDVRVNVLVAADQVCAGLTGTANQCAPYAGQRWWRIREDGGVVTWDVSVDGSVWTVLRSEPVTAQLDRVVVALGHTGDAVAYAFAIEAVNP